MRVSSLDRTPVTIHFACFFFRLDPSEDPLCVFLLLDYYAIKSEEYQYFIQLTDEYEHSRNVSLLPNFAFSLALAHFHLGDTDTADKLVSLFVELLR